MGAVKRAERLLIGLENGLLVAIMLAMVALSFLQVILRIFFHTGILWADPVLRHLVLWVCFLGAALAGAENKHFAWEIPGTGKTRMKTALVFLSRTATIAVTIWLIRASWSYLMDEKSSGDILCAMGRWTVPSWTFACAIPIGFFLIFLHSALSSASLSRRLFKD